MGWATQQKLPADKALCHGPGVRQARANRLRRPCLAAEADVRMRADSMLGKGISGVIGIPALVCLLACATAAIAISLSNSEVFRPAVGDARYVVVGSIAEAAPIDSTKQYQVSELFVEKVVVGELQKGELLQIEWRISTWYAPPDTVFRNSTDYVSLAKMEGVNALWCLGPATQSSESHRVRYLCDPLWLTEKNRNAVESAIGDLHAEQVIQRVRPEPDDMDERVASVEAVLSSWLVER